VNTRFIVLSLLAVVAGCSDDDTPIHGEESGTPYRPPATQREPLVAGNPFSPVAIPKERTGTPFEPPAPSWPSSSVVDVALPDATAFHFGADSSVPVARLPVRVEGVAGVNAPRRLKIESFSRAQTTSAGVDGVLLRVSRSDGIKDPGPARFTLDYSGFRWAYGGDWASRLSLWVVPECALSSPSALGCQARKLAAVNDLAAGTVSAVVDVGDSTSTTLDLQSGVAPSDATTTSTSSSGSTLLALSASTSGAGGDYQATSLSPAATWSAGGNSGDFSWSYPLRVPPSLGGPAPKVELSYSSSSVDGRAASTNNQASWIGEGFEWQPGSIERRYNGCADDMDSGANNTQKTGDLCWETDNASLSLSGHAGELLKDGTNANLWHLRNDDGTRIEHKTGGPNGDNNGEWWVATTTDGTQYWFGGRTGSNAALTVPVFGNHSGEPCHQTAFKDSSCTQAYRWMLDYVVDPFGNTMSLTYAKETNKYGKNNTPDDDTVYDRDGYLTKIEYGTRAGGTGSAPMQIVFTVADRCLSGCTTKDATHWPDVPWDRECTASTCGLSQTSPSFWSTKRLSSIKTQVWGGSSYRDVESWTLTHSFPASDQPTLWLDKISHTGLIGGTQPVPDMTFLGVAVPNRVDTNSDQYPAMDRYRMQTISSETGGKLDITYSTQDCVAGSRVPDQTALQNNALRCYPVKWTPEGLTSPINDFFHKYLVTDVVEADLSGSSSRVITHYDYLGAPAWHYTDDDGFVKNADKTWSVWRGYSAVRTTKGDPGEQTSEEHRFFRGMHGDKLPSGTRTVTLPAITIGNVPAVNDEDAFAGQLREAITFNGPGGVEVSATANEPFQSAPTATRSINGSTVYARHVDIAVAHSRTALDGGRGYRTTAASTTFDSFGMPTQIEDRGDEAVTGDERCTMTEYVRNTSAWIVDKRSRERSYAVNCSKVQAGGLTDDDVIGETQSSYDGQTWNVAPTKGSLTRVDTMVAYNSGSPSFITEHTCTYDSYGRKLQSTDIRGNTTTTAYQPATGGPVTGTTETSHLGWVTSTTLEPAWNLPLSTTDANGRRIDFAYDSMGRLTSVWLPGRDHATTSPSIRYDYLVRNNAPTVITTQRLNASGGYITSYKFFDNLMRDRQTQEADAAGGAGAVVTDYYYDSAGRQVKIHDRYLAADASLHPVSPSTNLFLPTQNIPRLKVKLFDGAGRETAIIEKVDGPPASSGGTELWRTTTAYGGDRTDVTPPAGGTSISSITDARGNTVEYRQYQPGHAAGSSSGFDRTVYEYNQKNQLVRVTDPAGNHWEYTYDLLGRKIQEIDPDKGTTTTTYTQYGDVETSTDGRGVTIAHTYDSLGRKATLRDGSITGPKRAEWVYDTLSSGTQVLGHLVKTIRYEGADQYIKEHLGYTIDYQPTSVKYTIPNNTTASGVNGAFTYVYTYNQDGSTATTRLPSLGDPGLGLETLTYGYNSLGKPTTLSTSLGATLVAAPDANTPGTQYTSLGELAAIHLKYNGGPQADITRLYDTGTRRLVQIWTTRATSPNTVADVRYSYDPMGNVTQISDLTAGDHQCFTSDHLQRLKEAWTPGNGDCSVAPSASALGGPARYWHTYSYDAIGNRTRLVEHATSTGDRDTTYTVPAGAHKLTGTSTIDGSGTRTGAYTYDASGNTLSRPTTSGGTQTLTWDAEGHLATSQDSTGTTSYLYDVDGNRLLRNDPTGKTLYLPGQELRFTTATSTKKTTRYYTHAGQTIAMRTAADGVIWLSGDHHDTAQISINAVNQAVSIRRQTPFGTLRSTSGTWPSAMDKGFVGGTNDNTGLVHLGAREYDPLIGRFISVDPVIDNDDPQQMQGYAYADNAPITAADANGMWPNWGKVWHAVSAPVAAAGKFVYDHAGTISTVTGVAALACSVIPPLQVIAPALGAISTVTGAIDTAKSCVSGQALDCALGAASLIPGGRLLKGGKDVLKEGDDVYKAGKAVHAADDLIDTDKELRLVPGSGRGPYIPRDKDGNPIPLRQQRVNDTDIPLPDPAAEGRPHTVLGGRVGKDGVTYRQSATFPGGTWPPANGHDVPWSRVDWHDHGRPWDHSNPHQHVFEYDSSKGGWIAGRRTFFL
jgi:RHS repeat-associated protein